MMRSYRRERRYPAHLNVPMTEGMREELEELAERGEMSIVAVARLCIEDALPRIRDRIESPRGQ